MTYLGRKCDVLLLNFDPFCITYRNVHKATLHSWSAENGMKCRNLSQHCKCVWFLLFCITMSCFESVTHEKRTSEIKYNVKKPQKIQNESSISHIVFIDNNATENRPHEEPCAWRKMTLVDISTVHFLFRRIDYHWYFLFTQLTSASNN